MNIFEPPKLTYNNPRVTVVSDQCFVTFLYFVSSLELMYSKQSTKSIKWFWPVSKTLRKEQWMRLAFTYLYVVSSP